MTQSGDETYLTAQEAMNYLGVSRNKLESLVDEGQLQKYRQKLLSRAVLFKKTELDALKEIKPINEPGEQ